MPSESLASIRGPCENRSSHRELLSLQIETFNGTLRAEYPDTHWFATLEEAKETIEAWRGEYNESRLHRALLQKDPCLIIALYCLYW